MADLAVTEVEWRYADITSNVTRSAATHLAFLPSQAGVVAATWDGGHILTVFGYMLHREVQTATSVWHRAAPRLQCSLGGFVWVDAVNLTELPASAADLHAFREAYSGIRVHGKSPDDLHGVRFGCTFESTGTIVRAGTLASFRFGAPGNAQWAIHGVTVRCAGYPIVAFNNESGGCSSAPESTVFTANVTITACLTNLYGAGYDTRLVAEYAAWYLLLGVSRVVVFESIEPDVQQRFYGDMRAQRARRNLEGMHRLVRNTGGRVQIVRGLAGWEMMRRTANHDHGQTLASNMCKAAARALAKGSGQTPYVMQMDIDEFLVPPSADGTSSHRSLAGALVRLTQHLETGAPASALYLRDAAKVSSRVERFDGLGRCLNFADVYYIPAPCNDTTGASLDQQQVPRSEDRRAALVRLNRRLQPDKFESGPSVDWKVIRRWNFIVRAKYIATANDDTLLGVHECCCNKVVHGVCLRPGVKRVVAGMAPPCAAVEHMPLEFWETRHLKHGFAMTAACSRSLSKGLALAQVDITNPRGRWTNIRGELHSLPDAWNKAITEAVDALVR